MRRKSKIAAALIGTLGVIAVLVITAVPSGAQEEKPPLQIEVLSGRAVFTDDIDMRLQYKLSGSPAASLNINDPSHMMVIRFTLQPGFSFPWHTHPGPVFVQVVEGKLTYVNASDCVKRPYWQNDAFLDPGQGNVHTAYNSYYGETVLIATLFDVTADGPFAITQGVEVPEDCETPGL